MLDCKKLRTFTPIIPAGTGPTCLQIKDAVRDMVTDLAEMSAMSFTKEEKEKIIQLFIKGLELDDKIDGDYEVMPGYVLRIKTMQQWQFEQMPEFNGY